MSRRVLRLRPLPERSSKCLSKSVAPAIGGGRNIPSASGPAETAGRWRSVPPATSARKPGSAGICTSVRPPCRTCSLRGSPHAVPEQPHANQDEDYRPQLADPVVDGEVLSDQKK